MLTPEEKAIENAFLNDNYEWRTIKGIASEAHTTIDKVNKYINNHSDLIVKSSAKNQNGEHLYSIRKKQREKSGLIDRLSSALKNRG